MDSKRSKRAGDGFMRWLATRSDHQLIFSAVVMICFFVWLTNYLTGF